jgi:dephospho-CoA kinase
VFVIPLLVENRLESIVDRVLVVDCPEEHQIRRLMARDGESRQDALRILETQVPREQRLAAADDVIDNGGATADLPAQVALLDRKYRGLAAER